MKILFLAAFLLFAGIAGAQAVECPDYRKAQPFTTATNLSVMTADRVNITGGCINGIDVAAIGAGGGGSGTPGGTSGQIQFNNAGVFGGVTNIPPTNMSANLSAAIDAAAGSTRGSLLQRGASTWGLLTPGTAGRVLTSNGAGADPTYQAVSGTGTVTSVDFSIPASSLFSVTGNPITASGTLALATTGTSGGIPYFSSASQLNTSALLAANQLVLGGGAATAPATLGSLGTTTTVLHGNAAGAPTFGAVTLTTDVAGILPGVNGGTSNGFFAVTGPTTSLKTFTLPNASATILTDNTVVTVAQGGTGLATLAAHQLYVGNGTSVPTAVATGTAGQVLTSNGASSDPTYQTVTGTGTVTSVALGVPAASIFGVSGSPVTGAGTLSLTTTGTSGGVPYFSSTSALSTSALLTNNALMLGGGAAAAPKVMASLGTTTTVLHGNAAGAPTFAAVVLTTDVSGVLPGANGGTNNANFSVTGPTSSPKVYTFPNASSTVLTDNSAVTVGQGGTGLSTLTAHALYVGNGTSAPNAVGVGTAGQVLTSNGAAADPTFQTNAAAGVSSLTAGTPNLVFSAATGAVTASTTVPLNAQSSNAAYTILSGDNTKVVNRTNTVTQTDPVPQATGSFATGFNFGYTTGTVGNTLTSTTSTINGIAGATGIKLGPQQASDWISDGANWRVALSMPQCATQTGTTFIRDDYTCAALPAASTATAGVAKLHNVPVSLGWVATVDPNNAVIAVVNQASTISAIIGAVEVATGTAATVTVKKAPSGTGCSSGTTLHSGTFNANGTAATNQTLTVTTSSLAAGDRLCITTTGTTAWTAGAGIGNITVFLAPS